MKSSATSADTGSLLLQEWSPRSLTLALTALWELTKPRVTMLVLLTTVTGVYLRSTRLDLLLLINVLVGTGLLAGGTAALNQFMERNADRFMRRTARRPLPSGRLQPVEAMVFGMAMVTVGTLYLLTTTNPLTAGLGWFTSAVYLLVYTPMKPKTPFCSLVGAIPGAVPPVMGWTAAGGGLDTGAFLLFSILFLWQFPHILAIAWVYRDDYDRGGFKMLPSDDPEGRTTGRLIVLSAAALLVFSMGPYFAGLAGVVYLIGAIVLGVFFLRNGIHTWATPSVATARRLLRSSVMYLPLLLLLLTLNRV